MSFFSGLLGSGELSSANKPRIVQVRGVEIGPEGLAKLRTSLNRVVWAKAELDRAVAAEVQAQVGRQTAARVIRANESTVTVSMQQPVPQEAKVYQFPVERAAEPTPITEDEGDTDRLAEVTSLEQFKGSDERRDRIFEAQVRLKELHGEEGENSRAA